MVQTSLRFEGPPDNARDFDRLSDQYDKIFGLMKDGEWRSLAEIEYQTSYPQASISAQLRHMRKLRFGGHTVEKRRRQDGNVWEYKLIPRRAL